MDTPIRCRIEFDMDVPANAAWSPEVRELADKIAAAEGMNAGPVELVEALFRTAMYEVGLIPKCSSTGYPIVGAP